MKSVKRKHVATVLLLAGFVALAVNAALQGPTESAAATPAVTPTTAVTATPVPDVGHVECGDSNDTRVSYNNTTAAGRDYDAAQAVCQNVKTAPPAQSTSDRKESQYLRFTRSISPEFDAASDAKLISLARHTCAEIRANGDPVFVMQVLAVATDAPILDTQLWFAAAVNGYCPEYNASLQAG